MVYLGRTALSVYTAEGSVFWKSEVEDCTLGTPNPSPSSTRHLQLPASFRLSLSMLNVDKRTHTTLPSCSRSSEPSNRNLTVLCHAHDPQQLFTPPRPAALHPPVFRQIRNLMWRPKSVYLPIALRCAWHAVEDYDRDALLAQILRERHRQIDMNGTDYGFASSIPILSRLLILYSYSATSHTTTTGSGCSSRLVSSLNACAFTTWGPIKVSARDVPHHPPWPGPLSSLVAPPTSHSSRQCPEQSPPPSWPLSS